MKHLSVIVAAGAVMAVAAACGGSSSDTASSAPPPSAVSSSVPASPAVGGPTSSDPAASSVPAAPAVVMIKDFAFVVPTSVAAGTTVQVTNEDGEAHTVTADTGGAFDMKIDGKGSASFTAPTKPGRYPFHCTYHSNMHGVLIVT